MDLQGLSMKQTYFPHDSNARNDIKVIKVRQKYGFEGYGIYFALLEVLFSEENKLCIEEYDTLAFALNCDVKMLKSIVEDFDLFVIEPETNCFYSKRLLETINTIYLKSKKASENAKKRWSKADVMQPHNNSNAIKVNKSKVDETKLNKRITLFQQKINDLDKGTNEDKENFFLYWSELNKSGTKMRFEMERTWDLSRRMTRWCNSEFNNINKKNKFPDFYDDYTYKKLDATRRKEYEEHLKSTGWYSTYSPTAGQVWNKRRK